MGKCCSSTTQKAPKDSKSDKKETAKPVMANTQPQTIVAQKPQINLNKDNKKDDAIPEVLPKDIKVKFIFEGKAIEMNPISCPEVDVFENYLYPVVNNLPQLSSYSYKDSDYKDIDVNKTIKEIFMKGDEKYEEKVHVVNVVYHGLDIPATFNEILSHYSSKTNFIACPMPNTNPFELRIFSTDSLSLTKAFFNIEEFQELVYFSDFSAYCNGGNYLYLSGGEETKDPTDNTMENKYLNWIVKINLTDLKLTRLDGLNFPRFWHSMIFIPNKYVFIVGGNNTKVVEILNTETGEISKDSELNEFHSEPTLCLVNANYLYCFMGFRYEQGENNYSNTIEKCNLRQKERVWEIISLSRGNEADPHCSIETRFFTIGYFNEGNLLIIGGDNVMNKDLNFQDKPKSYLFDYRTDSVREYYFTENALEDFNKDLWGEKFFLPMKSSTGNLSCIIPKQTTDKLKVYQMIEGNQLEVREFEFEESESDVERR